MDNSPKDEVNKLKESLVYVSKLLTTAIIVVLLIVGAFLIYYVFSSRIVSLKTGIPSKLSIYTIASGSMEPAIKTLDIIINKRVDNFSTLKEGDVITYKSHNALISDMSITHRIVGINEKDGRYEFITKGDANPGADSHPIQEDDIIGKTILKIPQLGQVQVLLSTKIGWVFIVLIPAIGIIIYDILKLFKVIGVTNKAENLEGNIDGIIEKEENKKILETLEKIKKTSPIKQEETPPDEDISNKNYRFFSEYNLIDFDKQDEEVKTDENQLIKQELTDEEKEGIYGKTLTKVNPLPVTTETSNEVLKNNTIEEQSNLEDSPKISLEASLQNLRNQIAMKNMNQQKEEPKNIVDIKEKSEEIIKESSKAIIDNKEELEETIKEPSKDITVNKPKSEKNSSQNRTLVKEESNKTVNKQNKSQELTDSSKKQKQQNNHPKQQKKSGQNNNKKKNQSSKHQQNNKQNQASKHQQNNKQNQASKHQQNNKQNQASKHQQNNKQNQASKHQQNNKQNQAKKQQSKNKQNSPNKQVNNKQNNSNKPKKNNTNQNNRNKNKQHNQKRSNN